MDDFIGQVGPQAGPAWRVIPAEYRVLHKFLNTRFADSVVLTFAQIEDLLGFALPDLARRQPGWWADADTEGATSAQAMSWTQANRRARPNLSAMTVTFERARA
ncbi:MAG: hypothetical protein R2752_10360 [Vicinamibacterales bacterium]